MVDEITVMMIWLGFFCAIFFAYYYFLSYRNKERMLLIEKNVDLSEIFKKRERHFPWFMVGYTLLGISTGMVISFSAIYILIGEDMFHEEVFAFLVLSASVLFGAIGIIIGHNLEQKKKKIRG